MTELTRTPKNFHLPLPPALYAGLRDASARLGAPATELAREAIDAWLKQEKRRRVSAEIAAFAETHAGTAWDIDSAWEAAGLESAATLPPWPNLPPDAVPRPTRSRKPQKTIAKRAASGTASARQRAVAA